MCPLLGQLGLKLLNRLRLGLSHLENHKFRHNFQECVSPIFSCGQDIETTTPFRPSLAPIKIVRGKPSFSR